MPTLPLFIALTGLALGLRYKVTVLIPLTALALLMTGAYGASQGASVTTTMLSMLAAAVILQLGYLGGAAIRLVTAKVRFQLSRPRLGAERI